MYSISAIAIPSLFLVFPNRRLIASLDNLTHSLAAARTAGKERRQLSNEREGAMHQSSLAYRGFVITPMAAVDGGLYAAMTIVCDGDGIQRASGVLGHFACAEDARAFALSAGKKDIDQRLHTPLAA
ncbi:hypothetical protein QCE73_15075 [Caballeronia sp. LZ029]|uniref:hypothetical protein n=1 Tax=Caballeronia sp. LZ029 TaxID=3038564 RepID=UPI00285BCC71|nr:hypothetical protein [Caballeronia sp. LZ029]MDR5744478.1 hypothetical protein [Caballeronia sp. LZ029]